MASASSTKVKSSAARQAKQQRNKLKARSLMDRRIALKQKNARRAKRRGRVRKLVSGTAARPRLTVFRSLTHIYAQIVDDATGTTLAAAGSSAKDAVAEAKGK